MSEVMPKRFRKGKRIVAGGIRPEDPQILWQLLEQTPEESIVLTAEVNNKLGWLSLHSDHTWRFIGEGIDISGTWKGELYPDILYGKDEVYKVEYYPQVGYAVLHELDITLSDLEYNPDDQND